ncbi:hypothetical protein Trisim1_007103 [Trichoderma cf. simile WF8]
MSKGLNKGLHPKGLQIGRILANQRAATTTPGEAHRLAPFALDAGYGVMLRALPLRLGYQGARHGKHLSHIAVLDGIWWSAGRFLKLHGCAWTCLTRLFKTTTKREAK